MWASSKAEEGLECGHGLPPAIMAENEFIEIKLESDRGSHRDSFRLAIVVGWQ